MNKIFILVAVFFLLQLPLQAQVQLTDRWARSIPNALTSTQTGVGNAVQVDRSGNVIAGGSTPVEGDYEDIVLAKYNPDGTPIWRYLFSYGSLMRVGGRSADHLNDMVVDSAGNIYFTASCQLIDSGKTAYMTVKVNKFGVAVWAQSVLIANPSQSLNGSYIRLDHAGHVTVAGDIWDNVGTRGSDIVVFRYANDGTSLWLKEFNYGATNDDFVLGLGVADSSGGVYIIGKSMIGVFSQPFVAKYNTSGDFLWEHEFGTGDNLGSATGIVIDHPENLYISGWDNGGMKSIAYSCNSSGAVLYNHVFDPSPSFDEFFGVAIDKKGDAYYTGMTSVTGTPGYVMVCAKYDPTGSLLWSSTSNGPRPGHENEQAHYIVLDNQGSPYILGNGYTGAAAGYDFAAAKFDSATGALLWTARYNGPISDAEQINLGIECLAVDSVGGVYTTGTAGWAVTPAFADNMVTVKFADPTYVIQTPVDSVGDWNLNAPPVATPKARHLNSATGYGRLAQLHFTSINAPGNVFLSFYNSGVSDSLFDGTPPTSVSNYSWTFSDSGLAPYSVEVRFDYTQILNSGITDSSVVTIYHRPVPGNGNFSPLATTKVGNEYRATVTTLGEFILGIFTPQGGGGTGPDTTIEFSLAANWNLVSVPALHAVMQKDTLFPASSSMAFSYSSGYIAADTLALGQGYWLKFPTAGSASIEGTTIIRETVTVKTGWNLIGALSTPIAVASLSSDPPGLILSNAFGYANGYSIVDSLSPGRGYWVHSNGDGSLFLSSSHAAPRTRIHIVQTELIPPPPPDNGRTSDAMELPKQFSLKQNYPNPFNPSTVIAYELPVSSDVDLKIYNVFGQQVAVLMHGAQTAGFKSVTWNASALASGVYFYKITAGSFQSVKRMLLVK